MVQSHVGVALGEPQPMRTYAGLVQEGQNPVGRDPMLEQGRDEVLETCSSPCSQFPYAAWVEEIEERCLDIKHTGQMRWLYFCR